MLNNKENAIGVFDSGLGGLTAVKELLRQLPYEKIVYFGDTARVPYGTKSKEAIIRFSMENVLFLIKNKVKMVVIACNTSSSLALPLLKQSFRIPIIGVIEPGVKKAIRVTKNNRIGVIATSATVNSEAYTKGIKRLNSSIRVTAKACPLFVPLAEEGWFNKDVTLSVAREYLKPIVVSGADTVILGCTHYPLLKSVIQKVLGNKVTLVDSAQEVASQVKQVLKETGLANDKRNSPKHLFWVSDQPRHFRKLAKRFLGYDIRNVRRSSDV